MNNKNNEIKIKINDSNEDFSKIITIPVNEKTRETVEKLDQAHRNMIKKDDELEAKFQEAIEDLKKIFESIDEDEKGGK
jgi:CRISPR/Cas system-associated endonuclease/helicase Cas3